MSYSSKLFQVVEATEDFTLCTAILIMRKKNQVPPVRVEYFQNVSRVIMHLHFEEDLT